MVNQNRKPFDEEFPPVKSPVKISASQKANYLQTPNLCDVLPNEVDLALSRISNEHFVNPIFVGQLIRRVVDAWRMEVVPATAGPMIGDNRNSAYRKSDELAARKLLEGSSALAKADAATEQARRTAEIAEQQQRRIASLWHELNSIPKQLDVLDGQLTAIANERANLNPTTLEEAYESLYLAQFEGRNSTGDPDRIWAAIQQIPGKLAALDKAEGRIKAEIDRLTAREKLLRKELR